MGNYFIGLFALLRDLLFHPALAFRNISKGEYGYAVVAMFILSSMVTLLKSFSRKGHNSNFYSNQSINEIISFFNNPQIRWAIALISFGLFIFLIGKFCKLFIKIFNRKMLIMSLLSISSVGMMLHVAFFILPYFFSQDSIYLLRHVAFFWIIGLSIVAIKISQDATYIKSFIVFFFSGLPAVAIIGLPGIAPYSLWIVN